MWEAILILHHTKRKTQKKRHATTAFIVAYAREYMVVSGSGDPVDSHGHSVWTTAHGHSRIDKHRWTDLDDIQQTGWTASHLRSRWNFWDGCVDYLRLKGTIAR